MFIHQQLCLRITFSLSLGLHTEKQACFHQETAQCEKPYGAYINTQLRMNKDIFGSALSYCTKDIETNLLYNIVKYAEHIQQ